MSLSACATAANRRALYFPARPGGVWSDYETRRLAEAQTGVSTTAYTTTTTTTTKTRNPPSVPVRTGADAPAPISVAPSVPVPGVTTSADTGLPQTPGAITTDPASPTPPTP